MIMQCLNTSTSSSCWLSSTLLKPSNTKSKQSISLPRTQPSRIPKSFPDDVHFDFDDEHSVAVNLPLPSHVKSITSTSNPFVKHCLKLRCSSSYRQTHNSVLLIGTTPIREVCRFQDQLQQRPTTIECLLALDSAEIPADLDKYPVRVVRVSSMVLKKLSGMQSTESVKAIALMRIPLTFRILHDNQQEGDPRRWFPSHHRILVLDGIQDPGNLGTLLRSAMAFGWDGVFLLPGCCDPFNEKAVRASRAASFQIPIVSGSWIHLEAIRKEYQMKILAGHPANNEKLQPVASLSQDLAYSLADKALGIVLGSEGSGLAKETKQFCELLSIPMAGKFESLNVSVAGGIFLYMLQPENHRFT